MPQYPSFPGAPRPILRKIRDIVLTVGAAGVAATLLDAFTALDDRGVRRPAAETWRSPGDGPSTQTRRPTQPWSAPHPTATDELVVDWDRRRANSYGTAFPIDAAGLWATARHVVDDCDRVELAAEPAEAPIRRRNAKAARIAFDDGRADVAVVRSTVAAPAQAIASRRPQAGDVGTMLGFPQGGRAIVEGVMLGRKRTRSSGSFRLEDETTAWSVARIAPGGFDSLSGASGGPILDRDGAVVGVFIGANFRRGRMLAASLPALTRAAAATRSGGGAAEPLASSFDPGAATRRTRPIFCRVRG